MSILINKDTRVICQVKSYASSPQQSAGAKSIKSLISIIKTIDGNKYMHNLMKWTPDLGPGS